MLSRRTLALSAVAVVLTAAWPLANAARRAVQAEIRDVHGQVLAPFQPTHTARALFFIATDCPISNSYAPEIQRVCRDFGSRGVECLLVYEDVDAAPTSSPNALDEGVRKHLREYLYADIPAVIDRTRAIATGAGATTTPQAVVLDRAGQIRYRGRIDNFYAALGKPRQQVTERDLRRALDAVVTGQPVLVAETKALGCHIVDPAVLRKK